MQVYSKPCVNPGVIYFWKYFKLDLLVLTVLQKTAVDEICLESWILNWNDVLHFCLALFTLCEWQRKLSEHFAVQFFLKMNTWLSCKKQTEGYIPVSEIYSFKWLIHNIWWRNSLEEWKNTWIIAWHGPLFLYINSL